MAVVLPMGSELIDGILEPWAGALGRDDQAYRNHVLRMMSFCRHLAPLGEDDEKKLLVAAAFHDLGLWIEQALDYLGPSAALARAYLRERNLSAWEDDICLMIEMHHKVTPHRDASRPLVEAFRRADLADLSHGWCAAGIPAALKTELWKRYPNHGFHATLLRRACAWVLRRPLNPAPIFKW